ncbi:MAG: hypothetical protein ABSF26_01535 [Thermoguttaceae bacterium]
MRIVVPILALASGIAAGPAACAKNNAPEWAKPGVYVYRISTPDEAMSLDKIQAGLKITAHLLDGSVRQIPIINGIIGHDHPGMCNWDGLWPYWNRVTYRAGDWNRLSAFMRQARDGSNAYPSFHVNLTDVNVGLRDYPESRAFFKKLVETQSIYRREWNPATNSRDRGPPSVPQTIPAKEGPVEIFALVNYKRFWESGLARQMIDEFYAKLPYAPPLLYLDVLTLSGGNFATGFPDGPLGGSAATQAAGRKAIVTYLRSKGTEVATEGSGTMLDIDGTYAWLHGQGYSDNDYRRLAGGYFIPYVEQTFGSMGGFNVSPLASTPAGLASVREHYRCLLAGAKSKKVVPGPATAHVCRRTQSDAFDIPGTGDPFRGDWADLANNFYLITIQELYHIGKGNVRTTRNRPGTAHLRQLTFVPVSGGQRIVVEAASFFPAGSNVRQEVAKNRDLMLETPLTSSMTLPKGGKYRLSAELFSPGPAGLNVYVNDRIVATVDPLPKTEGPWVTRDLGETTLAAGRQTVAIDAGPQYAQWSDGTRAVWTTPYLGVGLRVTNGEVTFARDYDRMWPDSWSGRRKIYFFSWDGCARPWRLPADWRAVDTALLYPLTPDGRGDGKPLSITTGTVTPSLLPQVPYVLVPGR